MPKWLKGILIGLGIFALAVLLFLAFWGFMFLRAARALRW